MFKLILDTKAFEVPSDFPSLSNINPDIYNSLITNQQYEVGSQVTESVFQSFVNYLVYKQIPNIKFENISQYDRLSDEFDHMKDIVKLFRRRTSNLDISVLMKEKEDLERMKSERNKSLRVKTSNFKQIIEIYFNNNNDRSRYKQINNDLVQAAMKGNILQFKVLISKSVTQDDIKYILNDEEKTAAVYGCFSMKEEVLIPRNIVHESKEYVVKRIMKQSFRRSNHLKTIKFSDDSELEVFEKNSFECASINSIVIPKSVILIEEFAFTNCGQLQSIDVSENSNLKTIEKSAFDRCSLESLTIPSSIVDLKEGWCDGLNHLTSLKIKVNEKQNIKNFGDQFIIGKSDLKSDVFDVLLFAQRDIESATIPSFIKRISDYAFFQCDCLKNVFFEKNSQLKIIGKCAFCAVPIENIEIPPTVIKINNACFSYCKSIQNIIFPENSLVKSIGTNTFFFTSSIQTIKYPPSVTSIDENAFVLCDSIKNVIFSADSKLRSINKLAFTSSSVENLVIPSSVVDFNEGWCSNSINLNCIEVLPSHPANIISYDGKYVFGKSNLESDNFDVLIFARRNIDVAIIPPFIRMIAPNAFEACLNLQRVEFSPDSQLQYIARYAFSYTSLQSVKIPSSVTQIGEFSFSKSLQLAQIEFAENSQLKIIDKFAFMLASIEEISIPPSVTFVGENFLLRCNRLKKVSFGANSNLKTIKSSAFAYSSVEEISIPSSVEDLQSGWCSSMHKFLKLKIIPNKNKENIIFYKDQYIIGKSDPKSDKINVLMSTSKNIKIATIPSFVEVISKLAFNNCNVLKYVEFEENSKLTHVESYFFSSSSLRQISFPPNVIEFGDYAFSGNFEVQIIEFNAKSDCISIGRLNYNIREPIIIMVQPKVNIKILS